MRCEFMWLHFDCFVLGGFDRLVCVINGVCGLLGFDVKVCGLLVVVFCVQFCGWVGWELVSFGGCLYLCLLFFVVCFADLDCLLFCYVLVVAFGVFVVDYFTCFCFDLCLLHSFGFLIFVLVVMVVCWNLWFGTSSLGLV